MKKCQAKTLKGKRCQHAAKYPENNPKYCGHHKDNKQKGG